MVALRSEPITVVPPLGAAAAATCGGSGICTIGNGAGTLATWCSLAGLRGGKTVLTAVCFGAAVMMRDIQEMTYQEIADRLRLPEGTVKSRINRGRTELARQIQKLREQQDAAVPPKGPATGVTG